MKPISLLICGVALLATSAHAATPCQLTRVASVDMNVDDSSGRVNVPMQVGGQTLNMLIDTGGFDSSLSSDSVAALKLEEKSIRNVRIEMFGGLPITKFVMARDINFGGLKAPDTEFLVMPYGLPAGIGGILGPDILRAYDDDFDFANGKFSLFLQDHCPGRVVYWTSEPYAVIDMTLGHEGHITVPLKVDDKDLDALLDTGSFRSAMSLDTALSVFNIDKNDPLLKPVEKDRDGKVYVYKYPFKTLTLNGVTVTNPDVFIYTRDVDRHSIREGNMIMGMGILRQLHLYIAYGEHKIYVTGASAH